MAILARLVSLVRHWRDISRAFFILGLSMKIRKQLEFHEGRRLKPYRCTSGKITIGVGRNLQDRGISDYECDVMLDRDIDETISACKLSFPWFESLSQARQAVVVDMVFNLGVIGFQAFKRTIAYIEAGQYRAASREMLRSRWADQVGDRAVRLSIMLRDDLSFDEVRRTWG